MLNLLDKISELERQLAALRAEVEKEENKSKRWRAKNRGDYFYVSTSNTIVFEKDYNLESDNFRYDTHNYFQTKEDVQKYVEVLETERQLKKFADEHNDVIDWDNNNLVKYYLAYNYNAQAICTNSACAIGYPRIIYFSSKEIAEKAINTIGAENIKQYLTYEW